jgi:hypothetical protein
MTVRYRFNWAAAKDFWTFFPILCHSRVEYDARPVAMRHWHLTSRGLSPIVRPSLRLGLASTQ